MLTLVFCYHWRRDKKASLICVAVCTQFTLSSVLWKENVVSLHGSPLSTLLTTLPLCFFGEKQKASIFFTFSWIVNEKYSDPLALCLLGWHYEDNQRWLYLYAVELKDFSEKQLNVVLALLFQLVLQRHLFATLNRARFTDTTKNLRQARCGNLVYFIVLYRETENEIYRIKEGK